MTSRSRHYPLAIDLAEIAERLGAEVVRKDGSVGFGIRLGDYAKAAIANSILMPRDANAFEARAIASQAMTDAFSGNVAVTGKELEHAIRQAITKWRKQPEQPLTVVGSLLCPPGLNDRSIRIDGIHIRICAPNTGNFDRGFVQENRTARLATDDSSLPRVIIRVRARSTISAYDRAFRSLDFVRGCWNFSGLRALAREWTDEARPLNRVLPGPFWTVHTSNGKPLNDVIKYEPFYMHYKGLRFASRSWASVQDEWKFLRGLEKLPMGPTIRVALTRYGRALDSTDPESAFIKLWGVLELLTDTVGLKYDDTIRRCTFLYHDPFWDKYWLEILRTHRNRTVHGGGDEVSRAMLVRLHAYVVDVILFVTQSARFFKSVSEVGEFLSHPIDSEIMRRQHKLLTEALKFKRVSRTPRQA